jgi:hypothetical protein
MSAIEAILHSAHYKGIKEEVLARVETPEYKKVTAVYSHKVETAYLEILEEMKKAGKIEERNWSSSLLSKTSYNFDKETLVVEFNNGQEYVYDGITSSEYSEFAKAESQGKYFLSNIRGTKTYHKYDDNKKD